MLYQTQSSGAAPTEGFFCRSWREGADGSIIIEERCNEIAVARFPNLITAESPLFFAIAWEGFASDFKPELHVDTPDGATLNVRLSALKPSCPWQLQLLSLAGFSFTGAGAYRFTVEGEFTRLERTLLVRSGPLRFTIEETSDEDDDLFGELHLQDVDR